MINGGDLLFGVALFVIVYIIMTITRSPRIGFATALLALIGLYLVLAGLGLVPAL